MSAKTKNQLLVAVLLLTTALGLHLQGHGVRHSRVQSEMRAHRQQQQQNPDLDTKANPQQLEKMIEIVDNELSHLENTYQSIGKLEDTQVIGDEGVLISCKNVSSGDQMNIRSAQQNIDADLREIYFELEKLSEQSQDPNDPSDTTEERNRLTSKYSEMTKRNQQLHHTTVNFCPMSSAGQSESGSEQSLQQSKSFSDSSSHAFVDNLGSTQQWVYGNQTKAQYDLGRYQNLLRDDVKLCPPQFPFVVDDSCSGCQDEEVFDLLERECTQCGQGSNFDGGEHRCISDSSTDCQGNQVYDQVTEQCECPEGLPFFDQAGQACVSCYIPKYWDAKAEKCTQCPKGSYYSLSEQQCIECGETLGDYEISSLTGCHDECTLEKPYFDGIQCISCEGGVFNRDLGLCESCPSDLQFDLLKKVCVPVVSQVRDKVDCEEGYVFNQANGHCIRKVKCECPDTYTFNEQKNICECPESLPHDTGRKCVQCSQKTRWDQDLKVCKGCSANEFFNTSSSQCESCPEDFPYLTWDQRCTACPRGTQYNSQSRRCEELEVHYCPLGYQWSQDDSACVCPSQRPVPTEFGCQSECPQRQEWSQKVGACVMKQSNETTEPTIPSENETSPNSEDSSHPWIEPQPTEPIPKPIEPISIPASPTPVQVVHVCKFGEYWNKEVQSCVCLDSKPHRTPEGCVQCYPPTKWSVVERKCVYVSIEASSSQSQASSSSSSSTWSSSESSENSQSSLENNCGSNFVFNVVSQKCECPKEQPFNSGTVCVSCYLPMYWNYDTRQCKYCPEPQFFNALTKQCEYCPSSRPVLFDHVCEKCPPMTSFNSSTRGCTVVQCNGEAFFSTEQNQCVCNLRDRPFYSGVGCVACQTPNRWDISSRTCISGYDWSLFANTNMNSYIVNSTENIFSSFNTLQATVPGSPLSIAPAAIDPIVVAPLSGGYVSSQDL